MFIGNFSALRYQVRFRMCGDRAVELKRRYNNNDNGEELKKIDFHIFGSERFTGI